MVWWKKIATILLLFSLAALAQAQTNTLYWQQIGNLPDATGLTEQQPNLGVAGPFVGTHRGALIVAGGANFPVPNGQGLWDKKTQKIYYNKIWVATRGPGSDTDENGTISAAERPLLWHNNNVTLPGNRAYGASASHSLGMIMVGGSDGNNNYSDAYLLRWNEYSQELTVLQLPPLPSISVNGGAVVIGNVLYVMVGSNGESATGDLYAFDLSRIETDENGVPVSNGNHVTILKKADMYGEQIKPWQKLPSLPEFDGENLARTHMMLTTQNDGRGDKLYLMGGRRNTTLFEHPDAFPVELGDKRYYLHYYSDVWAFNPMAKTKTDAWSKKSDISIDGITTMRSAAGTAITFGQSHILLLSGSDGSHLRKAFGDQEVGWADYPTHPGFNRQTLSYNAITDAWTSYGDAPLITDPMGVNGHEVAANAVTTPAVSWEGSIVLVSGELRPRVRSPKIWKIAVEDRQTDFGLTNMTVLFVYLLAMVMVGVYFVTKNKNTDDYFRGGQNIPWWVAACSMYATMLSSLTYVALPALVYRTDWLVYIGTMMIVVVAPIAIYVVMPFFRQIDATSAYEYLSKRFNMPVRLFASSLFTLFHIGRMGIVMALTALALATVTPLDAWQCVFIMGMLCLIYCTLGGIEAVVWTDTIQTVVLLIGAIVCFFYLLNGIDGGFTGFIDAGMTADKFKMVNLDFGLGSISTLSLWVIILGGIGQNISSYTADQAIVQRYMVTSDARVAARAIWANAILAIPGALLFFCIGTGLFAFYQSQPGKLDPLIQIDQIFPAFIATELPVGIAGLIVAGIFAAAQSTVSTSMNSLSTTLVTDFLRPFNICRNEHKYLNAARLLTFTVGILGTLIGLLFINPKIGSLMEEYFKVIGMFMGALGGLFILGITTRRANGWGALIGLFTGVGLMVTTWLMQWANGYLFATIGILICLLVGYLASLLLPSDNKNLDGLTLHTLNTQDREIESPTASA